MDAFSTEMLLLHLIHRRMRQRGLMILNPSQIAGIKPAAALVAFEEVLTLAERRTADALAYHAPVRPRLVHRHDRGHVHLKKISPGFPRPIHIRRRCTSDLPPLRFHIVTAVAAVKLSETALRHFISTVTFSVQLHKLHSKVRTSGSSGPDTTPVSIIGPWHFGHGGRSISVERRSAKGRGMCSPPRSGESATLSVTDKCRVWDGDMGQCRKLYPVP
jgi:hypothetical protein